MPDRTGKPTPVARLFLGATGTWLLVMIFTPITIWTAGTDTFPLLASLGVLAQFTASLSALALAWTPGRIGRMALGVLVVSWVAEALGQASGWPFGRYHYTPALQPQLGGVPLLIPLAWLMMLAPAWAVTESILLPWARRLGRAYAFVFAGLAGLVFTAWDLYLDPQMVARDLWVWEQPGAYYGIPLSNYFGWWLTAAVISLLVQPAELPRLPLFWIYALTWLLQAIGLGVFWNQPGPALAGFVGMGVFALLAWQKEGVMWMCSSGRWWDFSAARSHSL